MRSTNPFPRQVTIPCEASLTSNLSVFTFTEDCVLHSAVSEVSFTAVAGSSGAFAGGFNAFNRNSSIIGISNTETVPAVHFYKYTPPLLAAGETKFTNSTKFDAVVIPSGTKFTVLADRIGLCGITGSFSLSFTPLSEWVNFREPRVAVRM